MISYRCDSVAAAVWQCSVHATAIIRGGSRIIVLGVLRLLLLLLMSFHTLQIRRENENKKHGYDGSVLQYAFFNRIVPTQLHSLQSDAISIMEKLGVLKPLFSVSPQTTYIFSVLISKVGVFI